MWDIMERKVGGGGERYIHTARHRHRQKTPHTENLLPALGVFGGSFTRHLGGGGGGVGQLGRVNNAQPAS